MSGKRILLRSPKDPFEVVTPSKALRSNVLAGNVGNLLFLQAAQRLLTTTGQSVEVDRLAVRPRDAARINERYDVYVLPLANAFRHSFEEQLTRWTQLIERLTIPVVVLGVGAQLPLSGDPTRLERMAPTVRAFTAAVLDRSPSIGVRGELTADYLASLGFRDVTVIGCPSMFARGPSLHVDKAAPELDREARIALTVSPYARGVGPVVEHHAEGYPNLVYFAQDVTTLEMLVLGQPDRVAGRRDPVPVFTSHRLFQERRVRMHVDPWPWLQDLCGYDFSFGTRIHGTIAALLAGVPATILVHDSRTQEIARWFEIPRRRLSKVGPGTEASELYAAADLTRLNDGHAARFEVFESFLAAHGLDHVFRPGEDPDDFVRRLAATPYPGPVTVTEATLGRAGLRTRAYRSVVRWRARNQRVRRRER